MDSYYKNLDVWKESIQLTKSIYKITQEFPKNELYSLVDQMRRASVSISSNIAEGSGRGTEQEYIRFLMIARGSIMELETQLIISLELEYINQEKYATIDEEIQKILKMLSGLIRYKKSLPNKLTKLTNSYTRPLLPHPINQETNKLINHLCPPIS